jgi:hypothetical protein
MQSFRLILLLICLPFVLAAQPAVQDVVYLKNGAIIKGLIKEYQPGDKLTIDIGEGRIVSFQDAEILRIEQQAPQKPDQPDDRTDFVILQNGSVFKGKIRSETPAELLLELSNGETLTIYTKEIREVQRDQPASATVVKSTRNYAYIPLEVEKRRKVREYAFREKGWFNATSFTMPNGIYRGNPQLGVGIHNLTGYQFSRLLGIGLGLGFDAYNPDEAENIASVYAEARSFLTQKRTAPFVSFGAGYGFAFRNPNNFITEAKGGLRVHPAIGLRLGADKDMNLLFDIGYSFQKATYTRTFDFIDQIEIRDVDYRRFTFRFGIMF